MKKILIIIFIINTVYANSIIDKFEPSRLQIDNSQQEDINKFKSINDNIKIDLEIKESNSHDKKTNFLLKEIKIIGSSVFSNNELKKTFKNKLGKQVSLYDLQLVAKSITSLYKEHNYTLSMAIVPTQKILNGTVTIKIIEGYIKNINIEATNIPKRVQKQLIINLKNKANQPPANFKEINHVSYFLNELPKTEAKFYIFPSKDTKGASDLAIKINSKKLEPFFSLDNYSSKNYGDFFINSGINLYNVLSLNQIKVLFRTSNNIDNLTIGSFYFNQVLNENNIQLTFSSQIINNKATFFIDNNKILTEGKSNIVDISLNVPFKKDLFFKYSFFIGLELINSKSNTYSYKKLLKFYFDKLRVVKYGFNYKYQNKDIFNYLSIKFSHGINGLGSSDPDSNDLSRKDGKIKYNIINIDNMFNLSVKNINIQINLEAQKSFQPLLANEEFSFGGEKMGIGLSSSEIVGDHGISISGKINNNIYILEALISPFFIIDYGIIWNYESSSQLSKELASSTALGVKCTISNKINIESKIALPIFKWPNKIDREVKLYFFIELKA